MVIALIWLTISLPFVYAAQQKFKCQLEFSTNTTEEKTESGVNTLSEYLHEAHALTHPVSIFKNAYKCHSRDEFVAFHPEYVSPPPDQRS